MEGVVELCCNGISLEKSKCLDQTFCWKLKRTLRWFGRTRSYADTRRRELSFKVGDFVYLKVSPIRGARRFGIKGKLAPRYIGPYQILAKCGEVAYQLSLPENLSVVHDVFHVS
jgi:hypothetical protein